MHGQHGATVGYENLSPLNMNTASYYYSTSHDDWDSFPPALKRKCFSTLERLRLAQGGSLPRPKSASSHGIVKPSRAFSTKSRPTLGRRNSTYFKHLRSRRTSPTTDTFSPSDAQFFLNLPDKVQRRHFTFEERVLLSGQPETVIGDAADDRLYELARLREINRSLPTLKTSNSSLSSLSTFTFDPREDFDSAVDMDSFHCFDDDDDLDLASTLDDYHRFYAPDTTIEKSKRQPSFRKVMSLSSLPYGTNHTSRPSKTSLTASHATIPTPQTFHKLSLSRPQLPQQRSFDATHAVSTIEHTAAHYQDPEARLKLRVFLASPQKFDEAIEFGFPSMDDQTHPRPSFSRPSLSRPSFSRPSFSRPSLSRPSLSRAANTSPCKTFLNDDNLSVFDGLDASTSEGDSASLPDRHSPYTPQSPYFNSTYLLSPSLADSPHSSNSLFKPTIRHDPPSEPLAQAWGGNREMTMRMTLTRPDLRADEKTLYAQTTGDDPLALEHLPPLAGNGDVWGQGQKERGFVKKFWRKVSGKAF